MIFFSFVTIIAQSRHFLYHHSLSPLFYHHFYLSSLSLLSLFITFFFITIFYHFLSSLFLITFYHFLSPLFYHFLSLFIIFYHFIITFFINTFYHFLSSLSFLSLFITFYHFIITFFIITFYHHVLFYHHFLSPLFYHHLSLLSPFFITTFITILAQSRHFLLTPLFLGHDKMCIIKEGILCLWSLPRLCELNALSSSILSMTIISKTNLENWVRSRWVDNTSIHHRLDISLNLTLLLLFPSFLSPSTSYDI